MWGHQKGNRTIVIPHCLNLPYSRSPCFSTIAIVNFTNFSPKKGPTHSLLNPKQYHLHLQDVPLQIKFRIRDIFLRVIMILKEIKIILILHHRLRNGKNNVNESIVPMRVFQQEFIVQPRPIVQVRIYQPKIFIKS